MSTAIEERHVDARTVAQADLSGRDRPLVLRGLVADWPIVQASRKADTDFATTLAGWDNGTPVDALRMPVGEDGVIGYNASLDGFNYEHYQVPVTDVLQRLAAYSRRASPAPGLAMQSALIADCLPGFLDGHALPFLAPEISPRIWIGNQVTTPAHFDESHNIACVVCGGRRFTLFAPEQVRNLYIGPLDFAPTGAAMSLARLDRPQDPRFPRLQDALAHAQVAELRPGDAIYIPPMWWHHVASLDQLNALVNYWWMSPREGGASPQTGLASLMHCILALKSLPPAERTAWKNLLDYYVFDEADPAAHIPGQARGILGSLTPDLADELRRTIRKYL